VGYIFYYEANQSQNINRMAGKALSIVSDLLPLRYWYWYRNHSVREVSTTGIASVYNKILLLLCNNFNDTLTSLTYILSIFFIHHFMRSGPRVFTFL